MGRGPQCSANNRLMVATDSVLGFQLSESGESSWQISDADYVAEFRRALDEAVRGHRERSAPRAAETTAWVKRLSIGTCSRVCCQ